MTIRKMSDISPDELRGGALVGKFICTPGVDINLEHGWPARIEATTAAKLTYRRLPRGAWDPNEGEWRVRPSFTGPAGDVTQETSCDQCFAARVRFVCDTAEEAIALHARSVATEKTITRNRRVALGEVDATALAGQLEVPAYLSTPLA